MDTSRSAADRVRPVLEAMERSIDAARRRRTQRETQTTPSTPTAAPPASAPSNPTPSTSTNGSDEQPRLKARPKRASTEHGFFQSRAG